MTLRPGRAFLIGSTLVVMTLVAVMVALGFWQLRRHDEKTAAIAVMRANMILPAMTFPPHGPVGRDALFRPSSVQCLHVAGWSVEAGRAAGGSSGFRYIAQCTTGAEGPGALVALGVGGKPDLKPVWSGGQVAGWIVEEPDHRSLLARAFGARLVLRPMLVAKAGAGGLKANAPPRPDDVPNNHISYAIQWFAFALIATIIYILALRGRKPVG